MKIIFPVIMHLEEKIKWLLELCFENDRFSKEPGQVPQPSSFWMR